MKFRSFLYLLIAVVVTLLSVSVGIFYWLASNNPLGVLQGAGKPSPDAAIFIPRQAPAMVSLLVNPDQLQSFRLAIAPLGERQSAEQELAQIQRNLLAKTGLTYEQDIQPWLGDELTLAVTTADIDRDRSNGQQPGYLLAIATKNPERSREFLQLFWQKRAVAGVDLVFEQASGVKIIYGNSISTQGQANSSNSNLKTQSSSTAQIPKPTLASAVVGDRFVLFANYPKVLRDAINNVQASDLSLNDSSAYQNALKSLPDQQIGLVFANLPELGAWLGETIGTPEIADADESRLYESLVVALELDRQGLLAETALLTAYGQRLTPTKPALSDPVHAAQFIPLDSSWMAAGENLEALWKQVSTGLTGYNTLQALVNQPLAVLQNRWQLDPVNDVFSWVQDEYALGLLPRSGNAQQDWVFVAKRSPSMAAAIENLDAIAQKQGLSAGTLTLGEQDLTAWTKLAMKAGRSRSKQPQPVSLEADVRGVHTTVGDYEIFATSVDAMNRALQAADPPLIETPDFKQAIAALAAKNDGYLYLDWATTKDLINQKLPILRLLNVAAQPLLDHVRSFTITSYGSESDLRRGAIFIQLKG
jgi:hypothetical protein